MSRLRLVAAFAVIQALIASNAARPSPAVNAISSMEPTPCAADIAGHSRCLDALKFPPFKMALAPAE
jgi:hypothetical protein